MRDGGGRGPGGALTAVGRSTFVRHLMVAVGAGAVLFLLTEQLSDFRNYQLSEVAYSFCAIAGLTILTGLSGQVSLGNGAFLFVGAYTVGLLLEHHPWFHPIAGYNNRELILVLIAAVLVSAAVGALVGMAAARLRGPYLAGVTIALALGLPTLPKYQHLSAKLGGHAGIVINSPAAPGTQDYQRWQAWICCLAAVITLFLLSNLVTSRVGRAFTAVRDDEIAASLSGLSVARVQVLAFVVSAGAAGLAGGLLALVNGQVGPDSFSLQLSLFLLAGAVFGGLGSLAGAAYGAVLITFMLSWSTDISNRLSLPANVSHNLNIGLYGAVLIVGMLAFPRGLQGLVRAVWDALRARLGWRGSAAT